MQNLSENTRGSIVRYYRATPKEKTRKKDYWSNGSTLLQKKHEAKDESYPECEEFLNYAFFKIRQVSPLRKRRAHVENAKFIATDLICEKKRR